MALEQKLHLKLSQKLVMTPSLQQAIKLLQLGSFELQEVLNQEMLENPLLEETTEEILKAEDPEPGLQEAKAEEPAAESAGERDSFDEIDYDSYFQDYMEYGYNSRSTEEYDEFPLENTLSRPPSLAEHLGWQLGMSDTRERIKEIVVFLIGNLDGDGYLRVTPEEVESAGPYTTAEVAEAMTILQSLDPIGVGARDLRECLLLQLAWLEADTIDAENLVRNYWDLFASRQYPQLSRALGISMKELEQVIEVIKRLDPKPGCRYDDDRVVYVQPDVYVHKVGTDYVIQINDDGMPRLRINGRYRQLLKKKGKEDGDTVNYVKDKIRSAIWLIKSIDQRQRTIYKVAESIVRHQRDFLDHGIDQLRPLVLRVVADDIQMHESTVSRVVANKYIHTPRGLFPMKYFFHSGIDSDQGEDVSSLSVKRKILTFVREENPKKPLSDSKIMKYLNKEGINIARRTVAKYRDELKIPSSTDRKQLF